MDNKDKAYAPRVAELHSLLEQDNDNYLQT
jgi:hypothetical protein